MSPWDHVIWYDSVCSVWSAIILILLVCACLRLERKISVVFLLCDTTRRAMEPQRWSHAPSAARYVVRQQQNTKLALPCDQQHTKRTPYPRTRHFYSQIIPRLNYESLEAWPYGQRMEDYQIAILKRNKNTTRGKRLNHYQMDYLVCNESSFSSVSLKYGGLITWLGAPEKGESKK